jgi:selenocysteine lyase/cysteine desulfurase
VMKYLQSLDPEPQTPASSGRASLVRAMEAVRDYEASLSRSFLDQVGGMDRVTVYGVRDPGHVSHRVPTFCFNVEGVTPEEVSTRLAEKGIGVRDGHMYSPRLINRLGLTKETGAVRVSLVHYNTVEEIARLAGALAKV